jgi:lipid-A-disaccharide synthase
VFGAALSLIKQNHPDLRVVIPVADAVTESIGLLSREWPFPVVLAKMADRFDAFAASDAAMAKSGTVTLELALADVPMVVAYRVSPATAFLVRRMGVGVEHASLVNLLAGREVVPEFLQEECTPERLASGVEALLVSGEMREVQRRGFREVVTALGETHPSPSERAAKVVLDVVAGHKS